MNAFEAGDELRVHLLNMPFATNRMMNRSAMPTIEEVLPVFGVEITLPEREVAHAEAAVAAEQLEVTRNAAGECVVKVTRIDEHEIILIS
jgi:hypothetical protein